MKLYGYLEANWYKLLEDIPPRGMSGKKIKLNDRNITLYIGIDSKGYPHLLIGNLVEKDNPIPESIQEFEFLNASFNRLEINQRKEANFLDIWIELPGQSTFFCPFSKFCEDFLGKLDSKDENVSSILGKVLSSWKRFWRPTPMRKFTEEWERGLFGELLFLASALKLIGNAAVRKWTGPGGEVYDFQGNENAVEVKTTIVTPHIAKINNLNQLDHKNLKSLHLISYLLTRTLEGEGQSLLNLIESIESILSKDSETLDLFYNKLEQVGYDRSLTEEYGKNCYELSKEEIYIVDDIFPSITRSSFKESLDSRIMKVRYDLELTNIESLQSPEYINSLIQSLENA